MSTADDPLVGVSRKTINKVPADIPSWRSEGHLRALFADFLLRD